MNRIFILLLVLINCSFMDKNSLSFPSNFKSDGTIKLKPYTEFKKEIKAFKGNLKQKQKRFFTYINCDTPDYWIGTKWDFNGTTSEPKSGTIACGYFVTTVLQDFGIPLKRYYLAQQAAAVIVSKLTQKSSIKTCSTIQQLEKYVMNRNQNEVYIVGLDFHVGFIIREDNNLYFLHSNYINREGVIKEKMATSKALNASKSFTIGSLSQNVEHFK